MNLPPLIYEMSGIRREIELSNDNSDDDHINGDDYNEDNHNNVIMAMQCDYNKEGQRLLIILMIIIISDEHHSDGDYTSNTLPQVHAVLHWL